MREKSQWRIPWVWAWTEGWHWHQLQTGKATGRAHKERSGSQESSSGHVELKISISHLSRHVDFICMRVCVCMYVCLELYVSRGRFINL